MAAIKFVGLYWLLPLSVLLTLSFFVLFALRKETVKWMVIFGKSIVAFLWLAAGIVLFTGIFTLADDAGLSCRGCKFIRKRQCPSTPVCPMIKGTAPYHGSMMDSPGHGMMKYHDYDDQGNIILEEEPETPPAANATRQ